MVDETTQEETLPLPGGKSEGGVEIIGEPGGGKGGAPTTSDAYVIHATSPKTTISEEWSQLDIPIIIIIEGELTISANTGLGPNGFLMFETRGTIYVTENVGTTETPRRGVTISPQLEGAFIADENFHIIGTNDPNTDQYLYISGSIVAGAINNGIGNYISERSTWMNNVIPTENISFNPKLIINAPREISNPIYTWKETK